MGMRYRYTAEQDKWILDHTNMSVADEYKTFSSRFGTKHTFSSFKTRRAKLNDQGRTHTRYTPDEDDWLMANYPHMGCKTAFNELNRIFGKAHAFKGFMTHICDLGLKVTDDRWRKACQNNGTHENDPIGTIRKRGRGQNWIKVAEGTSGWIPLTQYLLGEKSGEGMIIVHLDGNKANDDLSNLRVISKAVAARMSRHGFWSEEPIITETGIMCCKLQEALRQNSM